MKSLTSSAILFMVVLTAVVSRTWAGTQPIVTTDLLRLRSITSIDVSPDGSMAVFGVLSIHTERPAAIPSPMVPPSDSDRPPQPTYQYREHLFLLDLLKPDAVPVQLTFGPGRDRQPQLSPNARRLGFVRDGGEQQNVLQPPQHMPNGPDSPKPQVWVMSVDGGEARQVTTMEHGASNPQWSADNRTLLLTSSIPMSEMQGAPPWPSERPKIGWTEPAGLPAAATVEPRQDAAATVEPRPDGSREEIRAWLDANALETNPTVIDRLAFQDELSLRGEMEFSHLFVLDVDDQSAQPRQLTSGFFNHDDAVFMPDGRSVLYASNKATDRHPDRVLTSDIWRVDLDGRNDRKIVSIDGFRLRRPRPISDASVIAFLGESIAEPAYGITRLGLATTTADAPLKPEWLTDVESFEVFDCQWMGGKAALVFNAARRGGFPLMTISAGLPEPVTLVEQMNALPVGVMAFDVGGGTIVYSQCAVNAPSVLHLRDAAGNDRVVLDLNPWIAGKQLSLPVAGELTRPDGLGVQYWIMEPTNRERARKYPLCLEIHGGPSAMWGPGEFTMWLEFQLLCSWGYGVVYANPRGSGGYGYAHLKANFQDWGDGPAGDVLAAVDQALLQEWVDPNRLVVTGGSYGGYLTAWIIAHDHRFKAAVAQRGVYDLATFYGEGNAWQLVEWAMGGPPFDARYREIVDRNSPFTYVNRIKTPLLITHASQDLRTGVSQSEMLYRALKDLGRPVEYVRYPGAGHDLSRTGEPAQRMDRLNRIIEFFERNIENQRAAPVATN